MPLEDLAAAAAVLGSSNPALLQPLQSALAGLGLELGAAATGAPAAAPVATQRYAAAAVDAGAPAAPEAVAGGLAAEGGGDGEEAAEAAMAVDAAPEGSQGVPQCAVIGAAVLPPEPEDSTVRFDPTAQAPAAEPPRPEATERAPLVTPRQFAAAFDALLTMVVRPPDLGVEWDAFPNHLGEGARARLLALATLRLRGGEGAPAAVLNLPCNSNRVLLGAPADCELYQERVARWVAPPAAATAAAAAAVLERAPCRPCCLRCTAGRSPRRWARRCWWLTRLRCGWMSRSRRNPLARTLVPRSGGLARRICRVRAGEGCGCTRGSGGSEVGRHELLCSGA